MKFGKVILLPFIFATPITGYGTRGSFYERVLRGDKGKLCVDNPICVAQGLTEGACCPNENNEYHSCCNRECTAHKQCAQLAGSCCPTVDNVDLACCDHQPALDVLTPSATPSIVPSVAPTTSPSATPSQVPSTIPSESSSSPSSPPSAFPVCPSSAFRSVSNIETLTSEGGVMTFRLDNLPPAGSADVFVEVFIRGDYGQAYEFVEFRDGSTKLIASIDPNLECTAKYYSEPFTFSKADFNTWLVDGTVKFIIETTASVGTFCQFNDAYISVCYVDGSEAPSAGPSSVPSSMPSTSPSVSPSDQPSSSPSDTPSAAPSQKPSHEPSTTPSFSPSVDPSHSPSIAPTIETDRSDNGGGGVPIFMGGPMCQDNKQCADLGLQGACCPTAEGVTLACCSGEETSSRSCAANSKCAGLSGNCCPSNEGVYLACCN